jgi:Putative heavy-metal-binding
MILSTLPDIPGRTYDVIGVVFGWPSDLKLKKGIGLYSFAHYDLMTQQMLDAMVEKASKMGADAIVDIKITTKITYNTPTFVIGTAVKLR